jgi:hypothetical protein
VSELRLTDREKDALDAAENDHDRECVALWICGTRGIDLEEEWARQLSEDDERRLAEEERDRDRADACPDCDDAGQTECLDLELGGHDEETCRYGCLDGAVPCVGCDGRDPTWRDEVRGDEAERDAVDEIVEREVA